MRLFEEAVELSGGERRDYLDQRCGDDSELRAEVESLIRNDSAGTKFRGAIGEIAAQMDSGSVTVGETVGSYRLARELGHGGMGSVWLAARDDDEYQSEVAIKLIGGFSNAEIRERFLAERQILATRLRGNVFD